MKNKVELEFRETRETCEVNIDEVLKVCGTFWFRSAKESINSHFLVGDIEKANLEIYKIPKVSIYWKMNNFYGGDFNNYHYSGFVLLELKNVYSDYEKDVIKKLESIPSTYSWFHHLYKPNTIFVLVPVDSSLENYEEAWKEVANYYEIVIQHHIDQYYYDRPLSFSCTYQPNIYINPDCKKF